MSTLNENQIFDLLLTGEPVTGESLLDSDQFDDAALLNCSGTLAVSTDFIRGPHFALAEKGFLSFFDFAHYLVAANVSDIAAMGARPQYFLDVFRYPIQTKSETQLEFFQGLRSALSEYEVKLIGGDSGTYTEFVISGTCIGQLEGPIALSRSNLVPEQLLCYSGSLGIARSAQVALLNDKVSMQLSNDEKNKLLLSWQKPNVPTKLGPFLSQHEFSNCAQDTSDGLAATITSMCKMSGTGATIFADQLPISHVVQRVANLSERDTYELALSTSPDFGLLFSIDSDKENLIYNELKPWNCNIIGQVTDDPEKLTLLKGTTEIQLPDEEWFHGAFTA